MYRKTKAARAYYKYACFLSIFINCRLYSHFNYSFFFSKTNVKILGTCRTMKGCFKTLK